MPQPIEKNESGCTPDYCVKPDIKTILEGQPEERTHSEEEITIINNALSDGNAVQVTSDKKD